MEQPPLQRPMEQPPLQRPMEQPPLQRLLEQPPPQRQPPQQMGGQEPQGQRHKPQCLAPSCTRGMSSVMQVLVCSMRTPKEPITGSTKEPQTTRQQVVQQIAWPTQVVKHLKAYQV